MQITCLHTADVHIPTFQALFDKLSPNATIKHVVREDLLARAQGEGMTGIRGETIGLLKELSVADAVLCTCSTLGAVVDELADERFIRVDRPMMDAACQFGPNVLMAFCLESTRVPSLGLLNQSARDLGVRLDVTAHLCENAWQFFEASDDAGFARAVADSVWGAVDGHDCIILAQASMRVAEPLLADLGIPVLTSPEMAARAAIAQAQL